MRRILMITILSILAGPGLAQQHGSDHGHGQTHVHGADHGAMHQGAIVPGMGPGAAGADLSEPGQGAFAAIAEVVARLEADPATDWSKVDIDGLRQHLADMALVTLHARVTQDRTHHGMRFVVTGEGAVAEAIARMVPAHAAVMDGTNGWHWSGEPVEGGAVLEIEAPEAALDHLRGLGFFGLMALGDHHRAHHWQMATGAAPHGH